MRVHCPESRGGEKCRAHLVLEGVCGNRFFALASAIDRLSFDSSIKWGGATRLMILSVVTYVLVEARTGTPAVPTALGVSYGYASALTRVLGPTIAMSVTILKL